MPSLAHALYSGECLMSSLAHRNWVWKAECMSEISIESFDAEMVDAGDGIFIARSCVAIVTEQPGIPGTVRIHLAYDPTLHRAVAESVRVDRHGEGDEVTTTLLRDLRVQAIVKWAAAQVVVIDRDGDEPVLYDQYLARLRAEDGRTDDQNLREAVRLYRLASVINDSPLKLVSEELGVSVSTATRMMNRARVAGLVDAETSREVVVLAREQQLRDQATGPAIGPDSSGPSTGR